MFFKLNRISAPLYDGEAFRVDLSISFTKLATGVDKLHFGSIAIFLPAQDVAGLTLSQIESLAVVAARRELQ